MTRVRRWRPEVELLEGRTVLSAVHGLAPAVPVLLAHHAPHRRAHHHAVAIPAPKQSLALSGDVSGTWTTQPTLRDTGGVQTLTGGGTVQPLGPVQASGTLHTPGFIAQGRTTGRMTLSNASGSVTLRLVGPPQPSFSGPPGSFRYTIVRGTGLYTGASGTGTATFTERPEQRPVCPPGTPCPQFIIAPSFTMTFQAGS